MAPPACIDAPYNFVPLANWVHCPDWAPLVSHDIPFRDGLCGHLDLVITAHTPILVGREQTAQERATKDQAGQVFPYQLPDGRYALPGTALKGMIRNVVEIASFSRMSLVDDQRYGLRDISGQYVSAAYTARVRNNVRTGWMCLGPDGLPRITPCAMVRLSHRDMETWLNEKAPIFSADRSVAKKYRRWLEICTKHSVSPVVLRFYPLDGHATALGRGGEQGTPVFTGQISDSTKTGGKQRDFVFYAPDESSKFAPGRDDWNDFLFVHGDQQKKDSESMSWPGYWKDVYWSGSQVPVFYLRDKHKTRIGLAYMPRLAGDFSVSEMIEHTNREHLQGQGRGPCDFAEALFGTVSDRPERCLKGRVTFQHAIAQTQPKTTVVGPTILNGPKASYFPNYIAQNADPKTWTLRGGAYATCLSTNENPEPEVRGWKRYPVRTDSKHQQLTDEQEKNKSVQVKLNPLEAKTVFISRVHFHNLKPVEFGALCWALTWGGTDQLRHSLGMGKPFGFGQISIAIDPDRVELRRNCDANPETSWQACRDAFIEHMESVAQRCGHHWRDSVQIRALLGMADPANAARATGKLAHMRLEPKKRINDFLDAKAKALVLAEYPQTTHPATWKEQEQARHAEQERIASERAVIERQAQDAEDQRRVQAEWEALPEEQKLIAVTRKEIEAYLLLGEYQQHQKRPAIMSHINKLIDAALTWTSREYRTETSSLLELAFDSIGWSDPGQKRDKREKQERKRRERIVMIRNGSWS